MKRSAVNTRSQKPKKFISQSIITSTNVNTTYMKNFEEKRLQTAESILDFHFSKKRVRILSKTTEVKEHSKGIVYWMSREGRVQDNWSLLFAQKLALKNSLPLCICFCLVPELQATLRHYKFMLKGLQELEEDCKNLNINFNLLIGSPSEQIPLFVNTNKIGAVVCDFSPLRISQEWVKNVENNLPIDVPLCQVDGHNIVPVWIVSDKQEYAARTIRNKINEKLQIFLTEFPPVIKHSITSNSKSGTLIDWEKIYNSLECNLDIDEVDWAKPGYREACKELERFCEIRLKDYNNKRNDPLGNALSNLSPWFHFGQISIQRCILTVKRFKLKYPESVEAFCEEAIVRRELSDNFCYYNKQYDNLNGLAPWAYKTLDEHRKDERIYIYTRDELEQSKTHDDLWNSTQIQLVREGKIHGFLRMYWAKKILEWTKSPEEALQIAIDLNDKYSLDGNDPNGYVGCMWSIGGIHDQGWKERPIFGKIRYMNYEGCKRKFDVNAFVARYGGKVFNKT